MKNTKQAATELVNSLQGYSRTVLDSSNATYQATMTGISAWRDTQSQRYCGYLATVIRDLNRGKRITDDYCAEYQKLIRMLEGD